MIHLKTIEQINEIRKVCHITADMFNELIPKIKAGLSTYQIDKMFENLLFRMEENQPGGEKIFQVLCASV